MALVVQHNLPALNANNQLRVNVETNKKSAEKISSGYRINRAGDDAAGLAISEKMRGQIRGLDQATRNAQDGISLVQTAEGALQETHSILQRMRELAVQSSNGTYQSEVDRENINKEVDALKSEMDRIASSTHFNGKKLLNGEINGGYDTTAPSTTGFSSVEISGGNLTADTKFDITLAADGKATVSVNGTAPAGITWDTVSENGVTIAKAKVGDTATVENAKQYEGLTVTVVGKKNAAGGFDAISTAEEWEAKIASNKGLTFQIGANGVSDQQVTLNVKNQNSATLGVKDISVATQSGANAAIDKIDKAINSVSGTRADLGALQNRLEYTVNNLTTTSENLTAAESRIRDTDIAKEVMTYTKSNILQQASQAILAQANAAPQSVLQLLG